MPNCATGEVRRGGTPRPALGTSALPGAAAHALFLAFALWFAGEIAAHAAALRAEFNALAPRPRSNAPAPVEVKLHWQGAGLLEGALELTLLGDDAPVLRQRTHELALTAGTQTLRLLLPPRAGRDYIPTTEAHLRFLAKKGAIDLGRFPVSNSSYGTQNFLIAVCGAPAQQLDGIPRLWQTLRPDRFMPEKNAAGAAKSATSPMMMDAADLPASPLALCAFDLVLLEGDSFARLREKQLTALARWIEAGGSLCVVAADGTLGDEHLRFLDQFTSALPAAAPFVLDNRGRVVIPGGGFTMLRAELGRLVVAKSAPEADKDASAAGWTDAAAFLWKVHPSGKPSDPGLADDPQSRAARRDLARQNLGLATPTARAGWQQQRSGDEQRRNVVRQFLNRLLPQSTRLIPLPIVAAILGTFILVVGPGDWFVLGWIKRRRWTWLTFPVVAAAFTALTVVAAEYYLGAEDSRSALVVTDVGRDGRVLRESRLELLFAARDKEAATELRQCLAVPTAFGTRLYAMRQSPAGTPLFEGQFPARAILRQRLQQWTPQINRFLTFETAADKSGIRWDAITGEELAAKPNPARWFADRAGGNDFDWAVVHQGKSKTTAGSGHPDFSFMEALCILPRDHDLKSRLATAPTGDADLTDLALMAHDDPHTWLAIAIKRMPGEIRIYRRIYRTDE